LIHNENAHREDYLVWFTILRASSLRKKNTLMIIIILNESDFFFFWHIKCACSLQRCLQIFIAALFLLSIFFNFIFNYLRFIFNYKLFYYVLLRPLIPHAILIFLVLSRLVCLSVACWFSRVQYCIKVHLI